MAIKLIVLCGLFALALGFTIPEDQYNNPDIYYEPTFVDQDQFEDGDVLVRVARSPQFSAQAEHSSRHGTNAGFNYNRQIGKNLEVYGGAARNFRYNDNSAHAGLRYRF